MTENMVSMFIYGLYLESINQYNLMPKWANVIHRSPTQLKTIMAKQCYTHVVSNFTKI